DSINCYGTVEVADTQDIFSQTSELRAKEIIKIITAAIENYAVDNQGFLPENFDDLMGQDPPYLEPESYEDGVDGYIFSIVTGLDSYKVTATPVECGKTGSKIFIQERGKELIEQLCEVTTS
ncbi:MAG: hypothetical protein WC412_04660, partial [Candidatus Omnitrophota bacterium]